jgi:hypothetical protein
VDALNFDKVTGTNVSCWTEESRKGEFTSFEQMAMEYVVIIVGEIEDDVLKYLVRLWLLTPVITA